MGNTCAGKDAEQWHFLVHVMGSMSISTFRDSILPSMCVLCGVGNGLKRCMATQNRGGMKRGGKVTGSTR